MPLLDELGEGKLGYLYVRDDAIMKYKKGCRVLLLTPLAVLRGTQLAEGEQHQERIKLLDEQWETNNLQGRGLIAQRDIELRDQAKVLVDQEREIKMLRVKLATREARIKYYNSRPWWLRMLKG